MLAQLAGSSLLPERLMQAFHDRGVPVCNVYGATETGPFSIALPPAHAVDHVGRLVRHRRAGAAGARTAAGASSGGPASW
ncbi:hypothetical protein [Ramlibacter sp.]|uniref:hypothetical protein n=1 Tax=Ramlibacter sp. TaxID=1917967 RepID=UPI002608C62A|nr:hypothetical protein [Ramlibacter sp.]